MSSLMFAMPLILIGALNLLLAAVSLLVSRPFARRVVGSSSVLLKAGTTDQPFVSVHVAIHDEPPAMVIATLEHLAKSDHDRFEVLVIDNNTRDPAVWRPVRDSVAALGARFRFFHFDDVEGAKAGALNLALGLTDPQARYVAIVDADYQVTTDFLATAVAACGPAIQFVQFPQAYRGSAGADTVVAELSDYFETFPRAANRAQASLLTGTLSVISIDALRAVGGWPTRSITEDAELGVALWSAGARGLYVDREAGRGLLPMDLRGLRGQRRRWVTGNVQTLIARAGAIARSGTGSLAVVAQLTAWLGLLAIPLVTLAVVAAVGAAGSSSDALGWRIAEGIAVATIFGVLAGHAVRAVARRRIGSLAVTLAMLWTSSFGWVGALAFRPLEFRRTPKTPTASAAGPSLDTCVSAVALVTAFAFAAEGSPMTALALVLSATGLLTAPFVDGSLRRAALRGRGS